LSQAASASQEQRLTAELASARALEYQELIDEVENAAAPNDRTVQRLRRELRRVNRRDYFPPPERAVAKAAVEALAARFERPAVALGQQQP
jgi:cobalamin biosynthesis protein CobD/CbiB